jgi:hypothetical protein
LGEGSTVVASPLVIKARGIKIRDCLPFVQMNIRKGF